MAAKTRRAPRRKAPTYSPLITACLRGTDLPEQIGKFEAHRILNPTEPGLLWGQAQTFAEIWQAYHGVMMTDQDAKAAASRVSAALDHQVLSRHPVGAEDH
jgi:hypothetical protein